MRIFDSNEVIHEYRGYEYVPWTDVEEDNIKHFHDVFAPDGQRISFDWSPYSMPSRADFQLWINLGCPDRIGSGPLTSEDLQTIQEARHERR